MARYYVDTCIWRDLAENRNDHHQNLGQSASFFLTQVIENNDLILWSIAVEREISHSPQKERILDLMISLHKKKRLDTVEPTAEQWAEAAHVSLQRKIPYLDAFHAILARDNDAVLITRNSHFANVRDLVLSRKPEDIL